MNEGLLLKKLLHFVVVFIKLKIILKCLSVIRGSIFLKNISQQSF